MESSSGKSLKLDVKRAVYFQNGAAHAMTIPFLNFGDDGSVFMDGSDDVGAFNITGELTNGYLYLTKSYVGKHKVYYLGHLNGSVIHLAYDFSEHWDSLKSKLDSNDIMAEIEFETSIYKLFLVKENQSLELFLANESEKPGKFKGLTFRNGKLVRVKAKVKCHIHLKSKDHEEKFEGKYDPYNLTYYIKKN
jgi:hypothetical protein